MFRIRAIRVLSLAGRRVLPGAEVMLDAQAAAELLRGGLARLVDEADLGRLIDAVAAAWRIAGRVDQPDKTSQAIGSVGIAAR